MTAPLNASEQSPGTPRAWAMPRLTWPLRLAILLALLTLIYALGTSLFSAARMKPLFYPYFRSLLHVSGEERLFYYLSIVRWTAHSLEYFGLFFLLFWIIGLRPLTALIVSLLLAAADEGHQYFLPDRTCSLIDLKFDALGAAVAFFLSLAALRLRAAPRTNAAPPQEDRASA
jgi:VanZ family protein